MNLIAMIPAGVNDVTVNGLHQWDYGRKLEIHSPALPAVVEVHFACAGMDEAVVRVGSAVDGSVTVSIPDRCLEQSAPITAWVYEVGENNGQTIQTITLNITPRVRPQTCGEVPIEISDKYTEAVGAMNEAVDDLKKGEVKVKKAEYADNAAHATEADLATEADHTPNSDTVATVRVNTLDDIKALLINHPFKSFGISVGGQPITVDDKGTISAWSLGTAVVASSSIRLCLMDILKNTITVYGSHDTQTNEWIWRVCEMPEIAKSAQTISAQPTNRTFPIYITAEGVYALNIVSDSTTNTDHYSAVIFVRDLTAKTKYAFDSKHSLVYQPQGTNEAGEQYGYIDIEHTTPSDNEYSWTAEVIQLATII